ncbi:MAG: multidrug efflux RND transporter permease subunit [Rudaea sp.]|uniref:efflux RND transporter permease subunit n=1 Tax=unclassified Rudaea TaxID=2627037 RepID=UPI0010F4BB6A|nr:MULTISPECIES: efflux RND transporter permease subunit [unclassified Rudaea]MBN8885273.1 multidrug efflux RND transporter permease subunit [Rudaea sp.]
MPRFFIDRPIFAWVIAILITMGGVIAILNLSIASYPAIAPTQVAVSATYQGADADTVQKTVTQVIEQQLTSIDNLMYFSSTSSANGNATITLTFQPGTDPDIAQVQTQNRVSLATPRLPSEVTAQGITVLKTNPDFLMFFSLVSEDGRYDSAALNNFMSQSVADQIARIPGVGSTRQIGSEYAMRIWLDADKLHGYSMSPVDALNAVRAQNVQIAAGSIGSEPAPAGDAFTAPVIAEGRFTSPDEFRNIILRTNNDGTSVRLRDVARVELGPFSYGLRSTFDGKGVAGLGVQLSGDANALTVRDEVIAKLEQLKPTFPPGVVYVLPYDTTDFIKISIKEVVQTLFEAIVLVFIVMLMFLQNFRATIIATLVIPVALMGGFLSMWAVGFSINQLTLFGMVLAIGIVVDDAIVVIENVERIMTEEGLSPKEATRKAMDQISGAVVAIALVLMAVFIPSALQSGSVGVIYKQFALTIALSTAFSAFLALAFTPALCATIIKPVHEHGKKNIAFRAFDRVFEWVRHTYVGHITGAIRHMPSWMAVFLVVALICGWLFKVLPTSFVPDEDQGYALVIATLPSGTGIQRTNTVMDQVSDMLRKDPEVDHVFAISGFSFVGNGENVGMAFVKLKDWDSRQHTAMELIRKFQGQLFGGVKDAMVFVVNLPTIRGLSQFGGFDLYLQDRSGQGHDALIAAQNTLLGKAAEKKDLLANVRPNVLPNAPQLLMTVDRVQAQSMGVSLSDVYTAIQLMLAPVYANDFFYGGRVLRVNMQADAQYRASTEGLTRFYLPSATQSSTVPTSGGGTAKVPAMIPLSNVVQTKWSFGPPALTRYNGFEAIEIVGAEAPGSSSGAAMDAITNIINKELPAGFGFDWTGQSLQEIISGNQAPMLYALSILVVFLCLAALYESWSIPFAVLLVVPLGITGALLATWGRGLTNDVYFKIGILTIIGLAAKNAILIVEFCVDEQRRGRPLGAAVIDAARLRLRPILMTSFAFILGVFPLAISTGAGANSRHAIGTGVIGGMLFATFLGLLFIPVFYVFVRRLLGDKLESNEETQAALAEAEQHGAH